MWRALPVLGFFLLVWTVGAARSNADEATVVLDRGKGAATNGDEVAGVAVRLVEALRAAGTKTRFVVYGTRPDGRLRAFVLRGDAAENLANAATREGLMFEGPTDPRAALELAVRRHEGNAPLQVFLVGPFDGEGTGGKSAELAIESWGKKAPEGSGVHPLGVLPERWALLKDIRGATSSGAVVLAAGEADVTTRPFSPFATEPGGRLPARLEADVRVPLELLALGTGGPPTRLLDVTSSVAGDEITPAPPEAGAAETRFSLRRSPDDGRVATLTFAQADTPGVLWLAKPPEPRAFRWRDLAKDARLCGIGGDEPLPFQVAEARADEPHEMRYRIQRSRVGPAPTWSVRGESGELPRGLDVRFGNEAADTDDIAFVDVDITFTPEPGRPMDAAGTLVFTAEEHPDLSLPYRVRALPGRVAVGLDAEGPALALPPAGGDATWTLRVEALDGNVPPRVRVLLEADPADLGARLRLSMRTRDGVVVPAQLGTPVRLHVGVLYEIAVVLLDGQEARDGLIRVIWPEQEGIEGEARGEGRVRARQPAVVVDEVPWAYRVEGESVIGDPPLRLVLDADGGEGEWRLGLLERVPGVRSAPESPVAWTVEPEGPGVWALVASGAWKGGRAGAFEDREVTVPLQLTWDRGAAPGPVEIRVTQPARWGAAGWVLLALAGLALGLGAWGVLQLRPAAVGGTLLYTVEGREGGVGRLELTPVGRRATVLTADASGKLHLGRGRGDAIVFIHPTRVGGMLVVPDVGGEPARHLLVDGLVVDVGRHRLRYVSGRPDDALPPAVKTAAEDLLGPEYDLDSGRIKDLLGRRSPPGSAPEGGANDSDASTPRERS